MIRLAILASAHGTNAQAIIEAVRDGKLDAQVEVVITNNENAGVIARAHKYGIPVEVIPSKGFKNREAYDSLVVNALNHYKVNTIALAGWMRIISERFIEAFGGRILNLHPALLPSFKGATAIADAFEHGAKITGCSVHLVTPELDGGPIVIQAAVPIGDDLDELTERVHRMEHLIFPQALQWFAQGRISLQHNKVAIEPANNEMQRVDIVEGCLISPPLDSN